jgi:hypothetical protein
VISFSAPNPKNEIDKQRESKTKEKMKMHMTKVIHDIRSPTINIKTAMSSSLTSLNSILLNLKSMQSLPIIDLLSKFDEIYQDEIQPGPPQSYEEIDESVLLQFSMDMK